MSIHKIHQCSFEYGDFFAKNLSNFCIPPLETRQPKPLGIKFRIVCAIGVLNNTHIKSHQNKKNQNAGGVGFPKKADVGIVIVDSFFFLRPVVS